MKWVFRVDQALLEVDPDARVIAVASYREAKRASEFELGEECAHTHIPLGRLKYQKMLRDGTSS